MKRGYVVLAVFVLVAAPVQAAGPLASLAKDIVAGIVKDFVQSHILSAVQQTLGPCKSMLAGQALTGMSALSDPSAAQMMQGLLGGAAAPPQAPIVLEGVDTSAIDPATRAQITPDIIASLQNATPLSADEADELVARLQTLVKAAPGQKLPCSPEDLKLVFTRSDAAPMMGGALRVMLQQFREMDRRLAEARAAFAQMSPAEQDEAIELIVADTARLDAEERSVFAGFAQSDLFGLPPAMRDKLIARLGAAP